MGAKNSLLQALRAIPAGQIAETARRAGLPVQVLGRLRRGEQPDVRLSTLERIAAGLNISIGTLLGEGPAQPMPQAIDPIVDMRVVRRLLRSLTDANEDARRVAVAVARTDFHRARIGSGLSAEEAAQLLRVDVGTVWRWELGIDEPDVAYLDTLREYATANVTTPERSVSNEFPSHPHKPSPRVRRGGR